MEQASVCLRCRTWEEDLYWKHFSSIHFFLFLPKDFHQHLVLPAKFAENMMRKLPDTVSLIDPSATVWDVELKKTENIEFSGNGWIQFVNAHNLEENNLLVFKYKNNLSFEVLIFDLESLCEKELSYFVKKYNTHEKAEYGNEKKRTITESLSMEVNEDKNNDDDHQNDSNFVASKKLRNCIDEEPEKGKCPRPTKKSNSRASLVRTRPKRMMRSCESKSKAKALSGKKRKINGADNGVAENELRVKRAARKQSDASERERNDMEYGTTRKLSHVLERDVNTLENGSSILETAHSHKSTERKTRARKKVATKFSRKRKYHSSEKEPDENGLAHNIVEEETEENGAAKKTGRLKKRGPYKSARKLISQIGSSAKRYLYATDYKSNRRAVTDIEKDLALKMALRAMTEKSFMAVMRPTAVYRRFYLNIPSEWRNKYIRHRNQPVVLRIGEKTWEAWFYFNNMKWGGFSGCGWKKFVVDNYLEEFDVCVVTLATEKHDVPAIMDVKIFRVIPEIVPPTPFDRSKSA